jgi:hypothetical protein
VYSDEGSLFFVSTSSAFPTVTASEAAGSTVLGLGSAILVVDFSSLPTLVFSLTSESSG